MQVPRQSKRIRMIKDPGDAPMGVSVFRSTGPARWFGFLGVFVGLGLCVTGIVVVVAASLKGEQGDAKVFQYTFIILVGFFLTAGSFVLIQSAKTKEVIDAEAAAAAAAGDEEEGEEGGVGGGGGKAGNGAGGGKSVSIKEIELMEKNGRSSDADQTQKTSPTEKTTTEKTTTTTASTTTTAATSTTTTKSSPPPASSAKSAGRGKRSKTDNADK